MISAVQSNRASNWNLTTSNHVTKTLTLPSNPSTHQVNVIFNGVSNPQYTRGLYVELTAAGQNHSYIWHSRATLTDRLSMPAGTYNVRINLVNHLDFTITRSGNNNNNSVITITIFYGNITSWGFEDVIYSPSMIPNWQPNIAYSTNDVVYFDDANDEGVNAGYYRARQGSTNAIPDQTAWAWEFISILYSETRVYQAGEIIFFNDRFWRAKQQVWAGNEPPLSWAWELLGQEFELGKVFASGDATYVLDGEIKTWYVAFGSFTAFDSTVQTHYDLKLMSIDYNLHNRGKYAAGEYVYYDGFYWRVASAGTWAVPSTSSSAWVRLPAETIWDASTTYTSDSVVNYEDQLYVLRTGTSLNQIPGVSGAWQPLSLNWSPTGLYNRSGSNVSVVEYDGKSYVWYGAHNSTNTGVPGSARNGWNELTDVWVPSNRYLQGDFVIYDGSFWELIVAENPTDQRNVPGIDFTVWREHPILFDPNRN